MRLHNYVPPAAAMYAISTPDELNEAHQAVHESLDDLIGPLASSYEGVLRAAGKRMSNRLRALATSITADAQFTPPDEDEVTDRDRLSADMAESAADAQRDAAREVADALEASGISFDVDAVFTDELLEAIGERTTFAADQELRSIYRDLIADAAEQGWTIGETAGAIIEKVDAVASYRAVAMARTDLVGLANGGSVHAATQTVGKDQPVYKTWLATEDDRTRDTHIDADGQSVLVNEYFNVGGVPLAYPGDPFGPDEEVINCRCTVIYGSEPASAVVVDPDAPPAAAPDPLAHVTPDPGLVDSVNYDLGRSEVGQEGGYSTGIEGYKRDLEQHLTAELAEDRVDVRIRTPADVAVEIANDGRFMSQFETSTSQGSLAPDMRRTVENTLFDYPRELPDAERPIYGYVGNITEEPGAVRSYGNTVWRLKASVRSRTTWTSKDSLAQEVAPSPLNRPSWSSVEPYATDHFDPISTPLRDWDTMYFEAQVHGGVTLADVEEVILEYSSILDKPYYEADAELIRAALRSKGFGDVPVIVRPSAHYARQEALDRAALEALDAGAGSEQGVGLGQDGLGVDAGGEIVPVAPRDDAERRQLGPDEGAALVEHAHGGVLEPVTATLDEQHERRVASLSNHLHATDDTSDVGGSQPSEGLPFATPNEEAPMSTTVTEQLADGDVALLSPIAWDAVLCAEGETTEDGRLLERGAIGWRDLPLTLMGMLETSWGHDGAKVAGRIDLINRIADELASSGELTSSFGVDELAPLIADRTVRGVSIDLAVLDYEYRSRETGEVLSEDELWDRVMDGNESDIVFVVLDGTIVGATVCPMPAIANAEISLAAAATAGLSSEGKAILASALEGKRQLLGDVQIVRVFTPFDRVRGEGLIASAVQFDTVAPPRAHFEITEFPGNTPLTITDDGRVFGHIATWDTCHVGIPGVCTTPPRSSTDPTYALFHQGEWPIAEGGTLEVGKLMLGTGHASLSASRMAATQHYDKPDMVGAYVRAHDGEFGIWVSGVVRPELSAAGLRELRANPPSGDWRQYNRQLELIAVCAVPIPGFPVVASARTNITAAAGEIDVTALIASAGQITPSEAVKAAMVAAGCACEDSLTSYDEGIDDLAELSA